MTDPNVESYATPDSQGQVTVDSPFFLELLHLELVLEIMKSRYLCEVSRLDYSYQLNHSLEES
jgi:hypothetical protein